MALFGMRIKSRRASSLGSFHTEIENSNSFFRRNHQKKSLGLGRTIFSGLSLSFGGLMCYVALHYLPAFLQTQKIISSVTLEDAALRLEDRGPIRKIFGPYIDAFSMQRTYLRDGQKVQAQFLLPEGAQLELYIQRCKPVIVVEIFKCYQVSEKTITVTNKTIGSKRLTFADSGFYHFKHKIKFKNNIAEDYKVVWSRK